MAGIKRDYYRLVNLDKSPFNLSLEDALQLGSSGALPVYVRVTERVQLSSRSKKSDPLYDEGFFLRLETVDLTRIENDHLAGTHGYLSIHRGIVDKRYFEVVRFPDPLSVTPFVRNMLDKHKVNITTHNGSLPEHGYHADFLFQKHELLCFTEDLEQLLNNEPTSKAANPEAVETDLFDFGGHTSEGLQYVKEVITQFWSTYDSEDPGTIPGKADVVSHLQEQGASKNLADAVDRICRPSELQKIGLKQNRTPTR